VDKPLHVRVAEALGWRNVAPGGLLLPDNHVGDPPGLIGATTSVPWYDREWSATGPLIDKYKLGVEPDGNRWDAFTEMVHLPTGRVEDEPYGGAWQYEHYVTADSPLKAVCLLLLELYEAGTLTPDRS
jgi:hypothetical protein